MNGHIRLNTDEEHAQRVVSMFKWLESNSPLQAMCPWCVSAEGMGGPFDARFRQDGWFKAPDGLQARAVVEAMKQLRASIESQPRVLESRATDRRAAAAFGPELQRALCEIGIFDVPKGQTTKRTKRTPTRTEESLAKMSRPKTRKKRSSTKRSRS